MYYSKILLLIQFIEDISKTIEIDGTLFNIINEDKAGRGRKPNSFTYFDEFTDINVFKISYVAWDGI